MIIEQRRCLVGLAVELGELDLGSGGGVGDGNIELELEFVAAEVVNVPASALPAGALGIGGRDPEPVVVVRLVHGGVGDQGSVLLLETLRPCCAVPRTCSGRQKRDLRQSRLGARIPPLHSLLLLLLLTLDLFFFPLKKINGPPFFPSFQTYKPEPRVIRTQTPGTGFY